MGARVEGSERRLSEGVENRRCWGWKEKETNENISYFMFSWLSIIFIIFGSTYPIQLKKQSSVKAAINTCWMSGDITNHTSLTSMIYYVTKTLWNINSLAFHSCYLVLQTKVTAVSKQTSSSGLNSFLQRLWLNTDLLHIGNNINSKRLVLSLKTRLSWN